MSFQIFILVGHLTNWTGHNLLTDNTLKKITQDVLVRCSVIVSDHNVKLAGHFQNLVGQCPMTDCYFQHWFIYLLYLIWSRNVSAIKRAENIFLVALRKHGRQNRFGPELTDAEIDVFSRQYLEELAFLIKQLFYSGLLAIK